MPYCLVGYSGRDEICYRAPMKVIVVGAGLAGLVSRRQLSEVASLASAAVRAVLVRT